MANIRQYIGARYVFKIYENSQDPSSAEWEPNVTYEPLTIVTYLNSTYASKKDVPGSVGNPATNPQYWIETGAYNGQIATLQQQIDTINNTTIPSVESEIHDLEDKIDTVKDRKFVFIGDSYQYGGGLSGTGNRWAQGWLGVATTALGLTENVDFWHNEYPGYGFTTSPGFIDLLQNLSPAPTDHDAITDIIVTGGLNDTSGVNSLSNTIGAFIAYCKTNYPNAKIHIGYFGNYWNNPQLRFDGRNVSARYQLYANKFGAGYIDNSQYLLHDANYYAADETWHPDQAGHNMLGYKMVNFITEGHLEAVYDYHGITPTFSTDVFKTMTGTFALSAIINNSLSIIKSQNFIKIHSDSGVTINDKGSYKIADMPASGINPAISGYSEAPVTILCNDYVDGSFQYRNCPARIVYKNDNNENRGLYIETNYPLAMNVYNIWIGPFEMILDTNLT